MLAPGAALAGHTVVEPLGAGPLGAVYRARGAHGDIALKVLHRAVPPEGRAAYGRAVELASRLRHPNIAEVLDRGAPEEPCPWLAMRLVSGGNVAGLLAGAADGLEPERVVRLIADAARGLDYAYQHGVLHGDVKPGNILLEPRPDGTERAVVGDFGLAGALDPPDPVLGYAAPERCSRAGADNRADVYALGCVLFQLLTGRLPFDATDPAAAIAAHLSAPVPSARALRPGLPAALDGVVAAALAKAPGDRYPTCTALATDALRALGATRPAEPVRVADDPEQLVRRAAEQGDTGAMLDLGHACHRRGEFALAEQWFRRAVEQGRAAGAAALGNLCYERGDRAGALAWYRWASERGDTASLYNLGRLLFEQGHLAEAEDWLRRSAAGGHVPAFNALGVVLRERGHLAEAEDWLRRGVEHGDPHAPVALGDLLRGRGALDEAEALFRRAAGRGSVAALNGLGNVLFDRGRLREAETLYRRAVESGDVPALTGLGNVAFERGDLADAEAWYRRAVAHGDPRARHNLGIVLRRRRGLP